MKTERALRTAQTLRAAAALLEKGFSNTFPLRPLTEAEKESRDEADFQAWFLRVFRKRALVNRWVYAIDGQPGITHHTLSSALWQAAGSPDAFDEAMAALEAVVPYGFVELWASDKGRQQVVGILHRARARAEAEARQ